MLYVTTRSVRDVFTAPCTMRDDRGTDGGLYVPFRFPDLGEAYLDTLKEKSFGQCVADVLNQFFACRLTGWDVDCAIGRSSCRLTLLNRRIAVAETWHTQQWDFDWTLHRLSAAVRGDEDYQKIPTAWLSMAIRIAVAFALYGEMCRSGCLEAGQEIDAAVASGDFSAPMAFWYARKMGLPVNTVISVSNENSGPWDLFYHGQLHTDGIAVSTNTPAGDLVLPPDLERLISAVLGCEETAHYRKACCAGRLYTVTDEQAAQLRQGMFAVVVSGKRMKDIISSVLKTHDYLLDPYGALAYGGLMDFRARTGEVRPVLLLTEKSPGCSATVVAEALGITPDRLRQQFHLN